MRDLTAGRPGFRSAVVYASQLGRMQTIPDEQCPYPNLSIQTTKTGMAFTIYCGGHFISDAVAHRFHTRTMEECMEKCAVHHPLCNSARFYADMTGSGWLNCELKSHHHTVAIPFTRTLAHSAFFVEHPLAPVTNKNDTTIRARDGRAFRLSLSDMRKLDDIDVPPNNISHETSLDDCLQRCADANATCKTAIFDVGLQQGFQNCYLFNGFPPLDTRDRNSTFMYLDELSSQYQSLPSEQVVAKDQAWIAGLVVGLVVGICLLAGLWFWCQKRRATSSSSVGGCARIHQD
jgi:hypothetical protein